MLYYIELDSFEYFKIKFKLNLKFYFNSKVNPSFEHLPFLFLFRLNVFLNQHESNTNSNL